MSAGLLLPLRIDCGCERCEVAVKGRVDREYVLASYERGMRRCRESREDGREATTHSGDQSGKFDPEGALPEDIVADLWGLPRNEHGTNKRRRDVGPFEVEGTVRAARSRKRTSLLYRETDVQRGVPVDTPYLLVVLLSTRDDYYDGVFGYQVMGWRRASDVIEMCEPEQIGKGKPVRLFDHKLLHPLDTEFYDRLATWKTLKGL